MKKILSVILVLVSMFLMASCQGDEDPVVDNSEGINKFVEMYKASAPTKVDVNHTTKIGSVEFKGTNTLVTGVTSTGNKATVQTWQYETIQTIEDGSSDKIIPVTGEPIKGTREYLEGMGERYNGGSWDEEGLDFAPVAGSIAINLSEETMKEMVYTSDKSSYSLSFVVEKANIKSVFGTSLGVDADVKVVITGNGAVVTGITVTYTAPIVSENEDVVYPDAEITISTSYTYDVEKVTLSK